MNKKNILKRNKQTQRRLIMCKIYLQFNHHKYTAKKKKNTYRNIVLQSQKTMAF